MRKFTKDHNDLRWLFPIAESDSEAEEIFDTCEDRGDYLADAAGVPDENRDLAIDCYMKGYSEAQQLCREQIQLQVINQMCKNLFPDDDAEDRFFMFKMMLETAAGMFSRDRMFDNYRKYLIEKLAGTGFDKTADVTEQLKASTGIEVPKDLILKESGDK